MFKYFNPRVLIAVLLVASSCAIPAFPATPDGTGTITAFYDMENGQMPGDPTCCAYKKTVPPQLLTDSNGNHFMRMTATVADVTPTGSPGSATYDPNTVRVEILVASVPWNGSNENDPARDQTFSFDVRFGANTPSETTFSQLYQWDCCNPNPVYGDRDGSGPTVRPYRRANGTFELENNYNYETERQVLKNLPMAFNRWVHLVISVHWTLDPSRGKVELFIDGKSIGVLSGHETILAPTSTNHVEFRVGIYGDGIGEVDFDNIGVRQGWASGGN
jgi:hypothetical protein